MIDHSVIADVFGRADAFKINAELEFERNAERYQLLRWAQQAFDDFSVVPPDTGICHQVNLEYLARVVFTRDGPDGPLAYPDTLVGTDSHTPMVNGLGVLGWGVGGIEAEAAMLGQPMSMLIPQVVGLKLTGELPAGTTATDLVLTVAELLRRTGVVGKFVEFYGPGVANVPLANRATIGNMSPEYGATCAIFPVDDVTLDYLRLTGRSEHQIKLVGGLHQRAGHVARPRSRADVLPDPRVGPGQRRAVDRRAETPAGPHPAAARAARRRALLGGAETTEEALSALDEASADSFPASDPIAFGSTSSPKANRARRTTTASRPNGRRHTWPSSSQTVPAPKSTTGTW